MSVKPLKRDIAKAIGVSQPMVSKYVRQGMPVYSVAAALQWREQHIDPTRRKEWLNPPPRPAAPPPPQVDLARIDLLFTACRHDFDRWQGDLRAALAAVPRDQRDRVLLDVVVMEKLVAPVLALAPAESRTETSEPSDSDVEFMGDFWYAVGAGEIEVGADGKVYVAPPAHYLFAHV